MQERELEGKTNIKKNKKKKRQKPPHDKKTKKKTLQNITKNASQGNNKIKAEHKDCLVEEEIADQDT